MNKYIIRAAHNSGQVVSHDFESCSPSAALNSFMCWLVNEHGLYSAGLTNIDIDLIEPAE